MELTRPPEAQLVGNWVRPADVGSVVCRWGVFLFWNRLEQLVVAVVCSCCGFCFVLITKYCHYDYYGRADQLGFSTRWQHTGSLFSLLLKAGSCKQRTGEVHAAEDERFFGRVCLRFRLSTSRTVRHVRKAIWWLGNLKWLNHAMPFPFRTTQQLTVT
jgi:hypothetical protein